MSDIVIKYNKLNKIARQEVNDFLDFLISRQKTIKTNSFSNYKNKILNVSVWSGDDCKIFAENQKQFNQWNIQEW